MKPNKWYTFLNLKPEGQVTSSLVHLLPTLWNQTSAYGIDHTQYLIPMCCCEIVR